MNTSDLKARARAQFLEKFVSAHGSERGFDLEGMAHGSAPTTVESEPWNGDKIGYLDENFVTPKAILAFLDSLIDDLATEVRRETLAEVEKAMVAYFNENDVCEHIDADSKEAAQDILRPLRS
jgi:RNA binding exosome subunit